MMFHAGDDEDAGDMSRLQVFISTINVNLRIALPLKYAPIL